jgi:hypothetical protein
MSSEPITFSDINYGTAITPGNGAFTATMLCAAFGFAPGYTNEIGTAVDIGALAAPDYRPSNSPVEWLWKPDTVQSNMTLAAALTLRNAVTAAYTAGKGR